jgi:DNA-binding MarR family transcriptional regulator
MQVTHGSRTPRASEGLAAQLDAYWTDLGRFIANRRLRSTFAGAVGELSSSQMRALDVLAGEELRMSELAARLGQAESTVTRMIDRLETAGLVQRRTSPPDRRAVVAELTPSGRRLAGELAQSRRQFMAELLATLPADERRELVRLTAKMTDALRQREGAAK